MSVTAPPLGLARLPTPLRTLLVQSAAEAVAAATVLAYDAHADHHGTRLPLIEGGLDAFRAALAHERTTGPERGDLLQVAQALNELRDTIGEAIGDLAVVGEAVSAEQRVAITGVLRDLVRTTATLVSLIESDASAREPAHARAHQLGDELRRALRSAHIAVADADSDVLVAVRGNALLWRLRAVGDANAAALRAVELLATQHA